jgi:glycerophosphoryl diester phosphodiesterase
MGRTGESCLNYTPDVTPKSIKVYARRAFSAVRDRVSEGGLEPPPPYRGLGPQPSASTKFRHSDRAAARVYETPPRGSTLCKLPCAVRPSDTTRTLRSLFGSPLRAGWHLFAALAGLLVILAAIGLRKGAARARHDDWPVNFAHRGASARAPENTLEAFQLAVGAGAGGLELDVHMTRDKEIVVIHDATVDRTTDGFGAVAEMELDELRVLDASCGFSPDGGRTHPYRGRGLRIPTLAEVYERFPAAFVNIDIKESQLGVEETVLRVIRDAGAEERSLVVSNDHAVVRRFRRVSGGEISTGASRLETGAFYLLSRLRLERLCRPAYVALQVPVEHEGITLVTPRFLDAAHSREVRVDAWTINDAGEMRRLLDLGVDVIMTDLPQTLAEVLKERRG